MLDALSISLVLSWLSYTVCFIYRKNSSRCWSIHRKWQVYFYITDNPLCLSLGVLTFFSSFFINYYAPQTKDYYASLGVIASFTLASLGWIIHVKYNSILHRRKHAIDLLKELKIIHQIDFLILYKHFAPKIKIQPNDVHNLIEEYQNSLNYKSDKDYPVLWAILRIANSYELLATAAKLKEIDKLFFEEYASSIIIFFYAKCLPAINHFHKLDSTAYQDLHWLVGIEWKNKLAKELL